MADTFQGAPEVGVYRPEEVAARLRVSKSTVRRWVRDGQLQCCHVGRIMRITEQQLQAFLNGANQ